jgi:hypothetical protein
LMSLLRYAFLTAEASSEPPFSLSAVALLQSSVVWYG